MLRTTHAALFRRKQKYPYLVSYHQLPWACVEPGSELLHKTMGPHMVQVFEAVTRSQLATASSRASLLRSVIFDAHARVPPDQWLQLLPGSMYFIPDRQPLTTLLLDAQQKTADLAAQGDGSGDAVLPWVLDATTREAEDTAYSAAYAPYAGWQGRIVRDSRHMSHYGPVTRYAPVLGLGEFSSPDLRLCCTAVHFGRLSASARGRMNVLSAPPAAVAAAGSVAKEFSTTEAFSFYFFYRPNRPRSEIASPFQRFYAHRPDALSPILGLATNPKWVPVTRPPARPAHAKAAPMPDLQPLATPSYRLPEREAIIPGDCFGDRALMWGMGF